MKLKIFGQKHRYFKSFEFARGYCSNGSEPVSAVSRSATKDSKDEAYFVQSLHVRRATEEKVRARFEGITNSAIVEILEVMTHWILRLASRPLSLDHAVCVVNEIKIRQIILDAPHPSVIQGPEKNINCPHYASL